MKSWMKCLAVVAMAWTNVVLGYDDDEYNKWTDGNGVIWSFDVKENECATIRGVYPATGVLAIPAWLGEYPVTRIGGWAFEYCTNLTSVTIPSSVTSIGRGAFYGCTGLTSVTILDGAPKMNIGANAFLECPRLTSATIGGSVANIGEQAFHDCTNLASVTFADGLEGIGEGAFYGCTGLTSVTIPGSVKSIGEIAFSSCRGLASVTIRPGVDRIGAGAFSGCTGLASMTLPESVSYVGEGAFDFCTGLGILYVAQRWEWTDLLNNACLPDECEVVYYADSCFVTLDANGGAKGTVAVTANFGKAMPAAKAPVRTGYTFQGYYTKESGGIQYYNGKMVGVRNWDRPVLEATLYAHWKANPSVITLNANGGKAGTSKVTAYYGKPMPAVAKAPTRTGYILQGIYSAKTGGTQYWDGDLKSKRAWNLTKAAYTFYAHWKKSTTTKVAFNANGGRPGTKSATATYGVAMPAATAPTRSGYTFLGYYTKKSGGVQYYDGKMTGMRKWASKAKAYTLYAHWARKATITLNPNGGTGGTAKVTATYGKAMPKATAPTRKGYTFMGYYNAKTGGVQYYSAKMASVRNWNGTKATYTFYARWAKSATITLDPNGGSGGTMKVTATYGKPMPAATAPVREGYDFLGIFNKRLGGTAYWKANMASARNWNGTGSAYTFFAQWMLSGLDPANGVAVYNGPLADAEADADVGWALVDGDESTTWTGAEGVDEWHLWLAFDEMQFVDSVQLVGEGLPEEGVAFAIGFGGDEMEPWDGVSSTMFCEILVSIRKSDGIPPMLREIYIQLLP